MSCHCLGSCWLCGQGRQQKVGWKLHQGNTKGSWVEGWMMLVPWTLSGPRDGQVRSHPELPFFSANFMTSTNLLRCTTLLPQQTRVLPSTGMKWMFTCKEKWFSPQGTFPKVKWERMFLNTAQIYSIWQQPRYVPSSKKGIFYATVWQVQLLGSHQSGWLCCIQAQWYESEPPRGYSAPGRPIQSSDI